MRSLSLSLQSQFHSRSIHATLPSDFYPFHLRHTSAPAIIYTRTATNIYFPNPLCFLNSNPPLPTHRTSISFLSTLLLSFITYLIPGNYLPVLGIFAGIRRFSHLLYHSPTLAQHLSVSLSLSLNNSYHRLHIESLEGIAFCSFSFLREMKLVAARVCELCNAEACVYCPSDSAFLCWTCDAKVHEANFLVARHIRTTICSKCKAFPGSHLSGLFFPPSLSVCPSCSYPASAANEEDDLDPVSHSSNSDCVSSTLSCATAQKRPVSDPRKAERFGASNDLSGEVTSGTTGSGKISQRITVRSHLDLKAEGILVNWCGKLGLPAHEAVRIGRNALGMCWDRLPSLPFRVGLVASLWFGFRFCGDRSLSTWQVLKRLEEISGVPAKLISAAESKLERLLRVTARNRRRPRQRLEEGWAECSA